MIRIYAIIAVLALCLSAGFASGYKFSNSRWQAKQDKAARVWAESLAEIDQKLREKERELLQRQEQVRVETKTIIKKIPQYITSDGCNISPAGVQLIRAQVTQLFNQAVGVSDDPR